MFRKVSADTKEHYASREQRLTNFIYKCFILLFMTYNKKNDYNTRQESTFGCGRIIQVGLVLISTSIIGYDVYKREVQTPPKKVAPSSEKDISDTATIDSKVGIKD